MDENEITFQLIGYTSYVLQDEGFVCNNSQAEKLLRSLEAAGRTFTDEEVAAEALRQGLERRPEGAKPSVEDLERLGEAGAWFAARAKSRVQDRANVQALLARVMDLALAATSNESTSRGEPLDLSTFETIDDFLASPGDEIGCTGQRPASDDDEDAYSLGTGTLLDTAARMADELVLDVLRAVFAQQRAKLPKAYEGLVPKLAEEAGPSTQGEVDAFLWDYVHDELDGESSPASAWVTEIGSMPFAQTLLALHPRAKTRLEEDRARALRLAEQPARINAMVEPEVARLVRLFPGRKLGKTNVGRLFRELLTNAVSPDGLLLVCQLVDSGKLDRLMTRHGQVALHTAMHAWLRATLDLELNFSSPLVSLVHALDEARGRDTREWAVTVATAEETFAFGPETWPYLLLFALTRQPDERGWSVIVRRFEGELSATEPKTPSMSVAGMVLTPDSVGLLSAQEMARCCSTDADTGKPLWHGKGTQYLSMRDLAPGFIFLIDTLVDETRTVH